MFTFFVKIYANFNSFFITNGYKQFIKFVRHPMTLPVNINHCLLILWWILQLDLKQAQVIILEHLKTSHRLFFLGKKLIDIMIDCFCQKLTFYYYKMDIISTDGLCGIINRQNQKGISIADKYSLTTFSLTCLYYYLGSKAIYYM